MPNPFGFGAAQDLLDHSGLKTNVFINEMSKERDAIRGTLSGQNKFWVT